MGNYAKVDELGFITPEKIIDDATSHVFIRIPCKLLSVKSFRKLKNWNGASLKPCRSKCGF